MNHLQDVINSLSEQANNSGAVPQSIEQVMLDLKGKDSNLSYKVRAPRIHMSINESNFSVRFMLIGVSKAFIYFAFM